MEININQAKENYKILANMMSDLVMERNREIRGMLAALVAGEHIYVGGPPGSGKSYMGKTLQSLIDGASDFANTFTAFSTPDEVVGPFNPSEIMKGNMIRNTAGMLPEANLARLEEIFKSNAGCLGILTDILVDGVFVQQGKANKIPLLQALATSNELPQDDSLAYLWDRFALRYWVGYLKSRENRLKALNFRKGLDMPKPVISLNEIIELRKLVKETPVSEDLQVLLLDIQEELSRNGFILSDRRLGRLQEICHAEMVVFGSSAEDAAMHIADGAWSEIDKISQIRGIVFKKANPELSIAEKEYDSAQVFIEDCRKVNTSEKGKALQIVSEKAQEIRRCKERVSALKQTSRVKEILSEIVKIESQVERIVFQIVKG